MSGESFGKRVWDAVEASQGWGFISDDIAYNTDADAYEIARNALAWERETVRKLSALIRSYERRTAKEKQ